MRARGSPRSGRPAISSSVAPSCCSASLVSVSSAGQRLQQAGQPGVDLAQRLLGAGQRLASIARLVVGGLQVLALGLLVGRGLRQRGLGEVVFGMGARQVGGDAVHVGGQVLEAVALLEALHFGRSASRPGWCSRPSATSSRRARPGAGLAPAAPARARQPASLSMTPTLAGGAAAPALPVTNSDKGRAPTGRAGADGSAPSSRQCSGAPVSAEACRSSPSAAPSAAS